MIAVSIRRAQNARLTLLCHWGKVDSRAMSGFPAEGMAKHSLCAQLTAKGVVRCSRRLNVRDWEVGKSTQFARPQELQSEKET